MQRWQISLTESTSYCTRTFPTTALSSKWQPYFANELSIDEWNAEVVRSKLTMTAFTSL